MAALEVITGIVNLGKEIVKDEDVQKFVCGTYSDGKIRNLKDAIDGEYLSPKQKQKATSKKAKKKNTKFKL